MTTQLPAAPKDDAARSCVGVAAHDDGPNVVVLEPTDDSAALAKIGRDIGEGAEVQHTLAGTEDEGPSGIVLFVRPGLVVLLTKIGGMEANLGHLPGDAPVNLKAVRRLNVGDDCNVGSGGSHFLIAV